MAMSPKLLRGTAFLILCLAFVSIHALSKGISVQFLDAEYRDIFETIGGLGDFNVFLDPAIEGRGSFTLRDVEPLAAIALVTRLYGLTYRVHGNTIFITYEQVEEELRSRELHFLHVKYLRPEGVFRAFELAGIPSSEVFLDEDSGVILLYAEEAALLDAKRMLELLDKPPKVTILAEEKSLIEIFHLLTEKLKVNLIADPKLESYTLVYKAEDADPWDVIGHIQTLAPVTVALHENTLVVSLSPVVEEVPEEEDRQRLKVHRLNYITPATAMLGLQMVIASDQIGLDEENQAVIFRGLRDQILEAEEFLAEMDKPLPQVLLEVWVQEIQVDAARNLGVDWRGTPSFSGGTSTPTFIELSWEPWELIWALRALEETGDAKLLASPKIATLSGKTASIFVGDRVPIRSYDQEGRVIGVTYENVGITLEVTPTISSDGFITIAVSPEVSTFYYGSDPIYPVIRTRQAGTTIRVKDGQPVVLGGLLREEEEDSVSHVPFVSSLPIIGRLFTWSERTMRKTEMHIYMIPRIITGEEGIAYSSRFYSKPDDL